MRLLYTFALLATLALLLLAGAACSSALPAPVLMPQVQVTRVALVPTAIGEATGAQAMAEPDTADEAVTAALQGSETPVVTADPLVTPDSAELGEETPPAEDAQPAEAVSVALPPGGEAVLEAGLGALQGSHNILLLGTDQNDLSYVGRTDSIMILAVDTNNGRAALVGVPRDMYLPIPGVGYNRINTAYAFGEARKPGGGIPLLISTVEKNFGIAIDNYMRIDFTGFKDVIDALGGVDITVDCPIYDEKNPQFFGVYTLEPGDYHMDGRQALYYVRSRKSTSDFDRARRQQQMLMAIRRRALEGDLLARAPALWAALRNTVDTDLDAGDFLDLARLGATIDTSHLFGMVIRPPLVQGWTTPQGAQVQIPDLPAIVSAIDRVWEDAPLNKTNQEKRACP